MLSGPVPRVYERWWRPALGRVAKGLLGPGMADERRIARLLLGLAPGDGVLDVACGTGNFSRSFATVVGDAGLVVGIDVSESMLTKAVTDTRGPASTSPTSAATRRSCRSCPRASTPSAASPFHLFAEPQSALDRMTAVLTPGGRLALFTSVRACSFPLRAALSAMPLRGGAHLFDHDERARAGDAGFTEIRSGSPGSRSSLEVGCPSRYAGAMAWKFSVLVVANVTADARS